MITECVQTNQQKGINKVHCQHFYVSEISRNGLIHHGLIKISNSVDLWTYKNLFDM